MFPVLIRIGPLAVPHAPMRCFLEARSPAGGSLSCAIVDAASGEVLDAQVLGPLPDRWSQWCTELVVPGERSVLFEMRPLDEPVCVRALTVDGRLILEEGRLVDELL